MNTDKAYLLGLVVGGGCFSFDASSFHIRLPYRQWGDTASNPARAGQIAQDILRVVKPPMMVEYGLDVTYSTGREWKIVCIGDVSDLVDDLAKYNIEPSSELHKTADISALAAALVDNNLKKRFIAGVADTIGSMAPSQRRFSDDTQIISFEISGFNYRFVCQLCNLLYAVGCVPDQILWQHPNMQSGTDSYYPSWKKGNKLRVTLDMFSTFGSVAFRSKADSSTENRRKESHGPKTDEPVCEERELSVPGVVAVHQDENFGGIPEEIRGGHYIHHKQICAALGCDHAPYCSLDGLLSHAEDYVSPFTVLHKDTVDGIDAIIAADPLLCARNYTHISVTVASISKAFNEDKAVSVMFGAGGSRYSGSKDKGYPVSVLLDAVCYIIAGRNGNLNGKRPRGNRQDIIDAELKADPLSSVSINVPDLLTPIIVKGGNFAAMVGPYNKDVYKDLISFDPANKYKMYVRNVTKSDLGV